MSNHISEEGPRQGHAAGDTSVEQQASQLASDIKYKARQKMSNKAGSDKSPAQVQALYRQLLASSPAPGAVKSIVKKKLFGEQVDRGIVPVSEHLQDSKESVFSKVFEERKYVVKVVDKETGNTSYRKADRAKVAELRANNNIRSVEITGRKEEDDAYKSDEKSGGKKAKKDYDGDGKIESGTAEYMGSRDKAIKKAMAKEEFIADAKQEDDDGEKKLDVMKGKNTVKVNPSLGEQIKAELAAISQKKIDETAQAQVIQTQKKEREAQKKALDAGIKSMLAQKRAMRSEACEKCDGDHDTKDHDKSKEQSDGTFDALKDMKPDAKDIDPREIPTRINLAKNKLRAMGLKMSYDMEGDVVEEKMGKIQEGRKDQSTLSPEQKSAARNQEKASFSGTPRPAHLRQYDQKRARGVKKQPGAKERTLNTGLRRANLKYDLGMKHSADYRKRADRAERQRRAEEG